VNPPIVCQLFKADSLPAILLGGGVIEPYLFSLLWTPGLGRTLAETVLRRLFSMLLDSGVIRSNKRVAPLNNLLRRLLLVLVVLAATALLRLRQMRKRSRATKALK